MKKFLILIALAIPAFFANASEASFKGGQEALAAYLASNVHYPVTAMENGIEGVVTLQFVVKPDGSIGSIKAVRMTDPDLEAEAIRVVKGMPAWVPAEEGGKAVESTVTLPVTFRLQ